MFINNYNNLDSLFNFFDNSTYQTHKVIEKQDKFIIIIEVPGMAQSDFTIEIEDQTLSIKGKKEINESIKEINKTFKISNQIDIDKIEALAENGILNISLPKINSAPKKKLILVK